LDAEGSAVINVKTITKAVEDIINDNTVGYIVTRNAERNVDPNVAAKDKGWIGIYRGGINYLPYTTGSTPWLAEVRVDVELQVASMQSGEQAEDKLQDAEAELLGIFAANLNLNGTVLMTQGYDIRYDVNVEAEVYFHAAIITLRTEVRA
jgi:hypothetical protein